MFRTKRKPTMARSGQLVNAQHSDINSLRRREFTGYSFAIAAKSAIRRCNLCYSSATVDAPSVFFYVAASAHLHSAVLIRTESMVAQAGHPQGWLVFDEASIATPVWATANQERCNSGGSKYSYSSEIDACQRPLPKHTRNISGFFWLYAVVTYAISLTAIKLPPQLTTLPVALWRVISLPVLLDACRLVKRGYELPPSTYQTTCKGLTTMKTFHISGFAVNKRGNTVGVRYDVHASSLVKAKQAADEKAHEEGYSHLKITRATELRGLSVKYRGAINGDLSTVR